MSNETENHPIPEKLYQEFILNMPFPCVDVVIPTSEGVLLVWRDNEPAKDQWWLPGGRVFKGERLADCAVRKAKEEIGLDCQFERIVHVEETIFDTGPWGIPVHTVNTCALLSLKSDHEPKLDGDHSNILWLKSIDEVPLHDYIYRCLERAQVF